MTWNYRIVRIPGASLEGGDLFEMREVYYDTDGTPSAMTMTAAEFVGDTPEEVAAALERALDDGRKRPVFDPPPEWSLSHEVPGNTEIPAHAAAVVFSDEGASLLIPASLSDGGATPVSRWVMAACELAFRCDTDGAIEELARSFEQRARS